LRRGRDLEPAILSGANLQNMARLVGAYGIFSIGLGLIIITGGIDLSVGSVFRCWAYCSQ
jgi:ribose transport system permease protein